MFKVRRGGGKEIPLIQAKEQQAALCWSSREETPHIQGERNPNKTVGVASTHQRADTLKPYSQKTSQSNHTRITVQFSSVAQSFNRV